LTKLVPFFLASFFSSLNERKSLTRG